MKLIKLDKNQKRVLYLGTYVVIVLGFIFLRSYMMLLITSAIMAVLFSPVYVKYIKKGKSPGTASLYTFLISTAAVVIPVTIIAIMGFNQISSIIDTLSTAEFSANIDDVGEQTVDTINIVLKDVGINERITVDELSGYVAQVVTVFGGKVFSGVVSGFSGIFGFITAAIIYIYVFLSMLKNNDKIIKTIKRLNPLGDEVTDLYLDRSGAMTKATVRGQFIIAFMQGLVSAAVLAFVGFENLFFFFLVFLTFMSVVPMGAGIITIPIGIGMVLTGNVTGGLIVIINHLLIVTNIDNVMRPKLVPAEAKLDPALMLLAVFSGLALFGFLGIVIGPIIMIMIVTTLQLFNEVFFEEETIDRTKYKKKKSLLSSLKDTVGSLLSGSKSKKASN